MPDMVFCSTEPIPNDAATRAILRAVAEPMGRNVKGHVLKSKSDWRAFLKREGVAEIVLFGVDDPAEYDVPTRGMIEMQTLIGDQLVPFKFQVIGRQGVLVIPTSVTTKVD